MKKTIEYQQQELKDLRKELNKRSPKEEVFGLSTPSSKQVLKCNSPQENREKRGGGELGHRGFGRRGFSESDAGVEVEDLSAQTERCSCGNCMKVAETINRSVLEYIPGRVVKKLYIQGVLKCEACAVRKVLPLEGVMPKNLYSNSFCAHMLVEHYFYGQTIGAIQKRWGINRGTFLHMAHRTAEMLEEVFDAILEDLRIHSVFIHADETTWSMDGVKSYAWYFGNAFCKVFLFPHTRSSEVPKNLLRGANPLIVLITDRYSGYVKALPLLHQFCYVHLLRDTKNVELEFPDDSEVQSFTLLLKNALRDAIKLCTLHLPDAEHCLKAEAIKQRILQIVNAEARHEGVQYLQNIFREHEDKMYHWTKSPDIPCENNNAERELRPTVIRRKISFGSQSEQGLKTSQVLMTVMHTIHARGGQVAEYLTSCFNELAKGRKLTPIPFPQ